MGADGTIRTTSPPFPGVTQSGTYTIGLLPAGMPSVSSIVKASTQANAGLINLSTNLNFERGFIFTNSTVGCSFPTAAGIAKCSIRAFVYLGVDLYPGFY